MPHHKMYPKSDAQLCRRELLHNTTANGLELNKDSERNTENSTEGFDGRNTELKTEPFSTNTSPEVRTSSDCNSKSLLRLDLLNYFTSDKVSPINNDHFGMMGLLSCMRAANSHPNLVTLAMGMDVNEFGLNLNTQESLYSTFDGPFSNRPYMIQHDDCPVPPEYMVNAFIRDKLAEFKLSRFKDDVLFFLFYGSVGDFIQLQAATELYRRNWRYNVEEKVWLSLYRIPGVTNYQLPGPIDQRSFYYFDPKIWRRVRREFQIDFNKLDKCPNF